MPAKLLTYTLFGVIVIISLLKPQTASAINCDPSYTGSCGSASGCPTGDAAIGVNFIGLQPSDVDPNDPNKRFTVTVNGTSSNTYSCTYSGGTARRNGSCNAAYNSAANNIECGIEHLDCRNGSCSGGIGFEVTVTAPGNFICTSSVDTVPVNGLNNCANNTPITVNCRPPQRTYTCTGTRSTGEALSCQSGSSCPTNYSPDTTKTCAAGQVCCYYNPPPATTPPPCVSQSASNVACGTSNTTCTNGPNCTGTCNVIGNYCSTGTCCGTTCCPSTGTCSNGVCTIPQSAPFTCTGIWASQPTNPCTSSPCTINLGANYAGTRSSPIQQCWSKDGVQWGCNTDNMSTSNTFACGTSSTVTMTALDSNNRQAVCPAVSITPTCSLSNTPPPPPPSQAGCFVCSNGTYRTTSPGNCPTNGNQQCNTGNPDQGACLGASVGQACGSSGRNPGDGVSVIANFMYPDGTPYDGEGLPYWNFSNRGGRIAPGLLIMLGVTRDDCNYNSVSWNDEAPHDSNKYGFLDGSAADWSPAIGFSLQRRYYRQLVFNVPDGYFDNAWWCGYTCSDPSSWANNNTSLYLRAIWPDGFSVVRHTQENGYSAVSNSCRGGSRNKDKFCISKLYDEMLGGASQEANSAANSSQDSFCTHPTSYISEVDYTVTPPTPARFNMSNALAVCNNTDHTPYTTITWGNSGRAAATATESPYDIYQAELTGTTAPADSDYTKVGSSTTTTFVDQTDASHTVKRNTTYYYKVWARNIYGGRFSNDVKYTTTGWCDPAPPELSFSLNNACYDASGRIGVGWNRLQPFLIPAADTITPVTDVNLLLTPVIPNSTPAIAAFSRQWSVDWERIPVGYYNLGFSHANNTDSDPNAALPTNIYVEVKSNNTTEVIVSGDGINLSCGQKYCVTYYPDASVPEGQLRVAISPAKGFRITVTPIPKPAGTSANYLASIRCRQFDGNIGACRNGCGWYACSNQCWPSGTALNIGCTGVGTPAVNYQVSGVPIPTAGSYTLSAQAHDSAGNLAQTIPQPFTIRTTCDATPPIVNAPNLNSACYDRTTQPGTGWSLQDIQVFASDDVGVVGLNFIITNTDTGAVNTYPASLSSASATAGYWSPAPSIPFPGPGQFSIKAVASDAAGNTQTSGSVNFTAADPCLSAWIQTIGGDVHSNTKIRMPTDQ